MDATSIANTFLSGIFVFLALGLCIFVHELGHFLVAKWRGLHVIAFSMGFKKVWGFKYGGVEYRIGCIPFGGYVELPQIDGSGEAKDENGNTLPKVSPLDKILTAFAGPFCNLLLGAAFAAVIWIWGMPSESPQMSEIEVAQVEEASPEYAAGLRKGDVIGTVNGRTFNCTWREFVEKVIFNIGKVELGVRRGADSLTVSYTPAENDKRIPGEKIAYPFFSPRIPVVVKPLKGSVAARAGIMENDIITAVDGRSVRDAKEFGDLIDKSRGNPVTLTISRAGRTIEIPGIIADKTEGAPEFYRIGVQYSPELPLSILEVAADSPARAAGIEPGDIVMEINGKKIETPNFFFDEIQRSKEGAISMKISRGDRTIEVKDMHARLHQFRDIGLQFAYYQYPSPAKLLVETIDKTYKTLRGIFSRRSKLKARNLSGPIGIVHNVGKIVYMGNVIAAIYFLAFISYSLAIFNLLPIPILDGGHIAIACVEAAMGRPVPERMLKPVYTVMVVLLIGLMLFVTYYDILRVAREFR